MENIDFVDFFKKNNEGIRNTYINIGAEKNLTNTELAEMVKEIVGFKGEVIWDKKNPMGLIRNC